MLNFRHMRGRLAAPVLLGVALVCSALAAACAGLTDDDGLRCNSYACASGGGGETPVAEGGAEPVGNTPEARQSYAKKLFVELYPEFAKGEVCGRCHAAGLFDGAPLFLAGATADEAYATISDRTKYPMIILPDFANSILLTKGQHAGAALLEAYPELAQEIVVWLRWEAAALDAQKAPSTAPVAISEGRNDVPLDALGGPGGVTLRFDAQIVSNFLRIQDASIAVAGERSVRVVAPRLFLVKPDGADLLDPADSFGGVDVECPLGATTPLVPASAIFASEGWTPWDPANKLRVELRTIEAIDIADGGGGPAECKDVAKFEQTVMPVLSGQGVGAGVNGGSCRAANCHGNAQKSPDMSAQFSSAELCTQIRKYLDFDNPANSRIVQRPTTNGHAGGKPSNQQGFIDFWVGVINAGEIF